MGADGDATDDPVLGWFSDPVAEWFRTTFGSPTPAQAQGWPAIVGGEHSLVLAPTGSGKTLAAFLWAIDRLSREPVPDEKARTRVLYLSPLRALAVDIEKNLRSPLAGVRLAGERMGIAVHEPTVGIRTGDTSANERRSLVRHPPDILITTPESLYLMLTSRARETLANVDTVIIDEIHAVAGTKRGSHLALTLERLEEVCQSSPQRIGLSATQRPLDEIARFLGGFASDPQQSGDRPSPRPRPVTVIDAGIGKELDLEVIVPISDMGRLGEEIDEPIAGPGGGVPRRSIWPAMHPRLLDLVLEHRSTIVFVNSRRLAERLATRLNELFLERTDGTPAGEESMFSAGGSVGAEVELVRAHHGSLSRERRLIIEDQLKRGELRGLVATSSLELGIDMGAVDLVVQVESPRSVAAGLQRVGRAGHQVGEPSRGRFFPKHRADLLEAAVVVERMRDGAIEETRYLRNPLDVLAQQLVAMCALDEWEVDEVAALIRRAAPFAELSDDVLEAVLDLLAGRYPSEEFAGLRPRIVWDRIEGRIRGRSGAQRLAVTNAGTIPDRGLFGVFLPDGTRVGELDEEMVYESRPGETFLLGASCWRIEDITFERVVVTPAPGRPGKMPFWHGEGPGRPIELGRAVGAFTRRIQSAEGGTGELVERNGLDDLAAQNLVQYLADQREATGAVPDDRTIVVERFRDEIGDWRVCILSPFGARVHAPWAIALRSRLTDEWGVEPEMIWSDDGIVLRLPESVDQLPVDELLIDPEEIDDLVVAQLPGTAMFASRFRECAARALLLPRRRPDQRTPLWQQRQRAADLLAVAAKYPTFPILLEATRECLTDVFDLDALRELLADLKARRVRTVAVETSSASPFAQSLMFAWIATYMYEGDAPLAERRAAALAVDRELLADLLGADELRELLDPVVLDDLELELQRLVPDRRARDADETHDLFRLLGPLSLDEVAARSTGERSDVRRWTDELVASRRAVPVRIADEDRLAAAEDAGRLRDALGVALPPGLPAELTESVETPLRDLVARFARTHAPFVARDVAERYGLPVDRVLPQLAELVEAGQVVRGAFRPGGRETEWCDDEVLRQLRRRSLAALRAEVEPVDGAVLARFLPSWQGVGVPRRGLDALVEVIGQLQGAAIPASVLERDVLSTRMADYRSGDLDQLCLAGEVIWVGAGALGAADGRLRLVFRDQAALLVPSPVEIELDEAAGAIVGHLENRGASFWSDLQQAVADAGLEYADEIVLAALWDLVWCGYVTNDSLAPVRALVGGKRKPRSGAGGAGRTRPRPGRLARSGPPSAAGRWSLVAPLREPAATQTEVIHARALQLLERYGVLTREMALAEGAKGGFAGVYPVLKALEEKGRVRRGYFVAGLGAAQFAHSGAVDRLRGEREPDRDAEPVVLSAVDPAQPYGAALDWPPTAGRPARTAGAYVVLHRGEPLVLLERSGRSLVSFPAARDDDRWVDGLRSLVAAGQVRRLEIGKIDGAPVLESDLSDALRGGGFVAGYRGFALHAR